MALRFNYNKADLTAEVCGIDEGDTIAHIPDTVEYYRKKYTVTKIASEVFKECKTLRSVTLPKCVTEIEDYMFQRCFSLQDIVIPEGVTKIGDSAFSGCTSLQSITIPDSVTKIGRAAFNWCTSLQSITIPDSVKEIGEFAFEYCKSLQSITIPDSVTRIGRYAFNGLSVKWGIEVANIYNEEGNVIIHPDAFNKRTKVNYLGKKQAKSSSTTSVSEEKQRAQKETEKTITAQKTEEKTTAQEPVVSPKKSSKQVANEADEEFSFGAKLWEPVKELMAANKVNMKAPKTDQPWCVFKFKSLDAQICLVYKKNIATVQLETYSGEEVKTVLDKKIASAPADHVLKKVQPEQSKRNKDKWMWLIDNEIDKSDSNIVKWYVDILTAIYRIIED